MSRVVPWLLFVVTGITLIYLGYQIEELGKRVARLEIVLRTRKP